MFKPVSWVGRFFKFYLLCPAHPAKIRVENKLGEILFPRGITIKNDEGVTFKLDANDWITRVMVEEGGYESDSLRLAKSILKEGGTFIDIGANFGLYSCMLGYENSGFRAYSIDPNYKILPRLLSNISLNRLELQIQVVNAAMANRFQLMFLDTPERNNLGTTVTSTIKNGAGLSVVGCSLEFILVANNIMQIDLLKIDIEGNEFSVLEEFPFDKYAIKNIIFEFNHLSKVSFPLIKKFFNKKGFEVFTISGKKMTSGSEPLPDNNLWIVNQNFKQ